MICRRNINPGEGARTDSGVVATQSCEGTAFTNSLKNRSCRLSASLRSRLFWFIAVALLLSPFQRAVAQQLEVGGGYTHITGDFGMDGLNVGAAWWFSPRVSIALDYDSAWDSSRITVFTPNTSVKSHIQNFLVGPRIFFPAKKIKKYKFDPFAELQFGPTHLSTKIQQTGTPSQSSSDTAFSWMLGGGADYNLNSHWTARVKLDLLRTHLGDTGQSRFRIGLGVASTFGAK